MGIYTNFWKTILFHLDAEQAHWLTMKSLEMACHLPGFSSMLCAHFGKINPKESIDLHGIRFPNRIGLAAGFDKNAAYLDVLSTLGFGHIEVGTITPRPQKGNPRPRLFRLPEDNALINRMGFNNSGLTQICKNLERRKNHAVVVGGNIGKNKDTPNEDAWRDYLHCFSVLFPLVDYFTINLSSPNTPGLRSLLDRDPLKKILEPVHNQNLKQKNPKPVFLKISPDLAEGQLEVLIEVCIENGLNGIVSTNTTIERHGLKTQMSILETIGGGGLSGEPLRNRSEEYLQQLVTLSKGKLTLISSGGIMNPVDIHKRSNMGADLIQIYSGLVYAGPSLVQSGRKLLLDQGIN